MADDYGGEVAEPDEYIDTEDPPRRELADMIDVNSKDVPNLATQLLSSEEGAEYVKTYLLPKILLEYEMAQDSMEMYRKQVAEDLKVFYGDLPPKKPPFDKLANLNIPIALENITRLSNRGEGELFGDWNNVFGTMPNGPDDRVLADKLSRHGNWQISEQIPDFKRQQRRGMLMFNTVGDVTFESFRDPRRKVNRHVMVTADEFYTPYTMLSVMPDWSDVPYRGRIYDYYRHDVEAFYGIWDENQIDLLLGLCQASDVSYAQLLVDKFLYMMPEDQLRLRDCMRRRSILDLFLDQLEASGSQPWAAWTPAGMFALHSIMRFAQANESTLRLP